MLAFCHFHDLECAYFQLFIVAGLVALGVILALLRRRRRRGKRQERNEPPGDPW